MLLTVALLLVLCPTPLGDKRVDELLASAARMSELGQPEVSAGLCGEALAERSLKEAPQAQQATAAQVADILGARPPADELFALLAELPVKHNGLFVSAHSLARALVFEAIERGESAYGIELRDILGAHGKFRDGGKAGKTFARVGEALAMLSRYEGLNAVKPLGRAFEQMLDEGWQEEAVYVGTELAAQLVSVGKDAAARDVIESLASLFPGGGDLLMLRRWSDLVDARLDDAPAEVLATFRGLQAYLPDEDLGAGAAASPSGEAVRPQQGLKPAAVADALSARRTVDLLTIERNGRQWLIESKLGASPLDLSLDLAPGFVVLDHEGIVFALDGPTVAVLSLELVVDHRGAAARSSWGVLQATYLLAEGESFRLDSKGGVTVR
ncbi:MAG: hypothetical protein ACI9EF_002524 [Pseudohongiellaceae bacterium]